MSLVVKDLNATDIQEYRDRLASINGFFDFMHEYFQLDMTTYRRYSKDEIERAIENTSDAYNKKLLQELRPRGDGRVTLRQVNPMTWTTNRYETAFGAIMKRVDGYYDIICIRATQTREVNGAKLMQFLLPSIGLCVLCPPMGMMGIAAITLVAQKLAQDLDQDMPNVVAGFIGAELLSKGMLNTRNGEFYLTL